MRAADGKPSADARRGPGSRARHGGNSLLTDILIYGVLRPLIVRAFHIFAAYHAVPPPGAGPGSL